MKGCTRHAYGGDLVGEPCPQCAHVPLQYDDAEEIIAGYGYCAICAMREILGDVVQS